MYVIQDVYLDTAHHQISSRLIASSKLLTLLSFVCTPELVIVNYDDHLYVVSASPSFGFEIASLARDTNKQEFLDTLKSWPEVTYIDAVHNSDTELQEFMTNIPKDEMYILEREQYWLLVHYTNKIVYRYHKLEK